MLRELILSILLVVIYSSASRSSHALGILTGPSFAKSTNAPLAGTLQLTTDVPSRVTVAVSDGTNTWERRFFDYGTSHSLPLLGFKPRRTNEITVTVSDKSDNDVTAAQPFIFVTDPLPLDFPNIVLLESKPEKMEAGYTLLRGQNNGNNKAYTIIVDSSAEVVWYSGTTSILDVQQLSNGDLFLPMLTSLVEMDMLGKTVRTWTLPAGKPYTHEAFFTPHGTILYLSDATRVVANFPTSVTNPNAPGQTTNVWYQAVNELSATNASLLNSWQTIDMLDTLRVGYLTFTITSVYGKDWEHANAIIEDPSDDSLIVSLRHQNAVIKFSRTTGQLKWILGAHEDWHPQFQQYLLTPVGDPFEWPYGQHAPKLTPQGTLLLFDDGNSRAMPFDTQMPETNNYSRAVEYRIDEQNMEISQVWEFGTHAAERIYSVSRGDTDWLPQQGNVLITYADVAYIDGHSPSLVATNARMARIQEVTHEASPEIVFDMALFDYGNTNANYRGYSTYRSDRIRDLYPARAVTDLSVQIVNGNPLLEFSADEGRTYVIEASTNLSDWDAIGNADLQGQGMFQFEDDSASGLPARYYRVRTQ